MAPYIVAKLVPGPSLLTRPRQLHWKAVTSVWQGTSLARQSLILLLLEWQVSVCSITIYDTVWSGK